MTDHYFENDFVKLHYYKFGNGSEHMLCFHGFGMHGKQFKLAEEKLGQKYTFWGFDLLFHKETVLKDQSIERINKGLSKTELATMIADFCNHERIERFSVLGYSMGSHYATAITEELPWLINNYIVAAPSSINPGLLVLFFSKNLLGKKILEKLMFSKAALTSIINLCKNARLIDSVGHDILKKEFGTFKLRFAFYACLIYLRNLETDEEKLIKALEQYKIKSVFIFGRYDKMYLPKIGTSFFAKFKAAKVIVLDENHEMINQNFTDTLASVLL